MLNMNIVKTKHYATQQQQVIIIYLIMISWKYLNFSTNRALHSRTEGWLIPISDCYSLAAGV